MTAVARPSIIIPVIIETRLKNSLSTWSTAPFSPPPKWTQYLKAMEDLKKCIDPNDTSNSMFESGLSFRPASTEPSDKDASPLNLADDEDPDQETVSVVRRVLSSVLTSSSTSPGQDSPVPCLPDGSDATVEHEGVQIGRVGSNNNLLWAIPTSVIAPAPSLQNSESEEEEFIPVNATRKKKKKAAAHHTNRHQHHSRARAPGLGGDAPFHSRKAKRSAVQPKGDDRPVSVSQ